MPIDFTRSNVERKLDRLGYKKGLKIKRQTAELLASHSSAYMLSADEIVARISVAANPVMVESVLSKHPDVFEYRTMDGEIYWWVADENFEEALEIANQ